MTFEEASKELETIVAKLEKGDIGLDEGVKQFEKGLELVKRCTELLDAAKGKITIVKTQLDKIVEEKFSV